MHLAVLFPGQGSQEPEMRAAVARDRPDLLEAVTAAVGADPFERVEEGTAWAQPAILTASLAAWSARPASAEPPALAAGHSLGEIAALVAAGALAERDAIELVARRGRLMQAAGAGGMLALLGPHAAERAPAVAARHGLAVANDNAPTQVVLSGPREALAPAAEAAREAGLRATPLPVAGAFHSPLMAPAVAPFRAALDEIAVRPARFPVLSGVTAAPIEDVRATLAEAIVAPVRWREVLLALWARGARRFEEVGPGRVLTGLARRTLPREELARA